MATKLTLSVDPRVIEAAKRYAAATGTSVSRLVEDYLAAITAPTDAAADAPMLARLRGTMADGDAEDHRAHLVEKYG